MDIEGIDNTVPSGEPTLVRLSNGGIRIFWKSGNIPWWGNFVDTLEKKYKTNWRIDNCLDIISQELLQYGAQFNSGYKNENFILDYYYGLTFKTEEDFIIFKLAYS